jgi:hypothetical protein
VGWYRGKPVTISLEVCHISGVRGVRGVREGMTARIETPTTSSPDERKGQMKTMTCRQLGGPCDVAHRGATADEVIKAQDQHLKDTVSDGHDDHRPALKEMKGRWRHPISGMGWYKQAKRDFADLPED